jgi:hypothetical protein
MQQTQLSESLRAGFYDLETLRVTVTFNRAFIKVNPPEHLVGK